MSEEKYYFVSYSIQLSYGALNRNTVTNQHPLKDGTFFGSRDLISWQEITKEEYDSFWEQRKIEDAKEAARIEKDRIIREELRQEIENDKLWNKIKKWWNK